MTASPSPQPARGGWHPLEWSCELIGTALLLLGGLSAVCLDFGPHSPLHGWATSPRLLVTGLLFAGTGSLITISPLGRCSGAHLNPVVTLAFWTQGKVHPHDVLGYLTGQFLGALLGTALLALLWGPEASALHLAATSPGVGVGRVETIGLEALMTGILVLTILLMTSSARTARWTPLMLWPLIAALVWQGAPYTGTSLNPARSFGPAVLAPVWGPYWLYVVGPLLGAALAVGAFSLLRDLHVVTARLFHDPAYPSTLASELPVVASG